MARQCVTALQVVAEPAYEPVSLAQAKEWLRIPDTASDTVLAVLIKAFREQAENLTLRAFIPRTLRMSLPYWPGDPSYGFKVTLPYAPAITLQEFQYVDTNGTLQTMDADDYVLHTTPAPGFIVPAWGSSWPAVRNVPDAVQVQWVAGYTPDSPDNEDGYQRVLPNSLKQWMQVQIAALEQNRGAIITGTISTDLPRSLVNGLLDQLVLGDRVF